MKKIKCYDCEDVFEAETSQEMLDLLYAHYMKEHKGIITGVNEEQKKEWMEKFNKDWSGAEEF